jgi:nucleotide-binding universal stress UspA family protein
MTNTKTAETPKTVTRPFHIVVGTDLSALGDRAVIEAVRVCHGYAPSELHVVSVADDQIVAIRLPGQEAVQNTKEAEAFLCRHVGALVDQYVASTGAIMLEKVAVYVTTGAPAECIVTLAESVDADLIVIGTHGKSGLKRLVLGSVAEEVVRRAPCGVFVIRPRDFIDGNKVPDVQPALGPGEHALQPFRHAPTYHYVHRVAQATQRLMPAI